MKTAFHLLEHIEIDRLKWDQQITRSINGRVYALSWYLNEMAPGWKALVTTDYSLVMPLPVRKKWGIEYIFQPAFTQQLGLFSVDAVPVTLFDECLEKVAQHFRYTEINANSGNHSTAFEGMIRKNYLLPLRESYAVLEKGFSRSAKRNISKAMKTGVTIASSNDPTLLVQLHRQRYTDGLVTDAEYESVLRLLQQAAQRKNAYFFYAENVSGTTIAASGYLQFNNRIIFLMNGNLPESLENGATHLLKDYAIRKFAGSNLIMDFEGSDTPAFARFYEQYGATDTDNYPFFKINRLPAIMKWIKQ